MRSALALLTIVGLAGSASANLIAADSYDQPGYSSGGLNGQNPVVLPGWSGGNAWTVGSANLQADTISLTNSATPYDDASNGKGKYVASSFDFFRAGFRTLDSYTTADTYYMSMFVNPGGAFLSSGSREHAVVGFTNFVQQADFENNFGDPNFSNVFGVFAGFRGEDAGAAPGEADLIIRARGDLGGGSFGLKDEVLIPNAGNETYHVLMRVDINGTAPGFNDKISWWVNPSDLTDEAALDASALAAGEFNSFAFNTTGDMSRKTVLTNKWARGFFWDETRLGTDLDSVTGIPAPGAVGLLGIAGLAASRRRR
jgi:MYXO-CTERM domain-containing protein